MTARVISLVAIRQRRQNTWRLGVLIHPEKHTLGERVWYAIECLPRNEMGKAPAFREIEARAAAFRGGKPLANNTLRKLIWKETQRPTWEKIQVVARVLDVDPEWIMTGTGRGPMVRHAHPVTERPRKYVPVQERHSATVSREKKPVDKQGRTKLSSAG